MMLLKKIAAAGVATGVAFATVATTSPAPAHANWWAGNERSGSCFMPKAPTPFTCKFPSSGSYGVVNGARQIGGFYVNPSISGKSGTIPFQYRVNGGGWINRNLVLNNPGQNYIDFGNGVRNFEFQFPRINGSPNVGATTNFKFNYDLDR